MLAETHRCGNVVSAVIMFCLRSGCHGSLELEQWKAWSSRDMCVNWNEPRVSPYNYRSSLALWTTLEYELVDANGVCQGIQKVRVEPATRSVVANKKSILKDPAHWSRWWRSTNDVRHIPHSSLWPTKVPVHALQKHSHQVVQPSAPLTSTLLHH